MAKDEKEAGRGVVVVSRVTKEAHESVAILAQQFGVTQSMIIWWAVRAYIKKNQKIVKDAQS